jgi:hypothetical protein
LQVFEGLLLLLDYIASMNSQGPLRLECVKGKHNVNPQVGKPLAEALVGCKAQAVRVHRDAPDLGPLALLQQVEDVRMRCRFASGDID